MTQNNVSPDQHKLKETAAWCSWNAHDETDTPPGGRAWMFVRNFENNP